MSQTTSTPVSTQASATSILGSTQTSQPNTNNSPSSTLYLFTFLATLLLLLAVSCAIVVRSFILRRRYRQRMDEAFATGAMLPPSPSQRRRYFGEKPLLWDAFIVEGAADWKYMQPVSAKIVSEKFTGAGELRKKRGSSFNPFAPSAPARPDQRGAIARWWRPSPPTSPAVSATDLHDMPPPGSPPAYEQDLDAMLQVSVLVQMPMFMSKKKERSLDSLGDEEVPDVAFGVTEIPWKIRNAGASQS